MLLHDRSILTEKVARRGLHLTSDYTTDPLATPDHTGLGIRTSSVSRRIHVALAAVKWKR